MSPVNFKANKHYLLNYQLINCNNKISAEPNLVWGNIQNKRGDRSTFNVTNTTSHLQLFLVTVLFYERKMWSWSYRRWLGHPGVQNERLQATWRLSAMKSLWLSLGTLKTCSSEPDWAQTLDICSDRAAAQGPLNSFYLVLNLHPISQQQGHPTQLTLANTGGDWYFLFILLYWDISCLLM